ncbi:hypothetical protein GmHk_03G006449 [Glycine max]|nr:hypothetical protein GmHk_03G006449 [Glycine max]
MLNESTTVTTWTSRTKKPPGERERKDDGNDICLLFHLSVSPLHAWPLTELHVVFHVYWSFRLPLGPSLVLLAICYLQPFFIIRNTICYLQRFFITRNSVSTLVYYNGNMISSYEGIMFECLSGFKVITISEDVLLDALRKTILYTNRGGDGCIECYCMKLKLDDDVRKIFLIYSEFNTKCPIELNEIFGRSLDEIVTLLHKSRKSKSVDEIIVLMRDKSM